jgi:hypothetical protein
MLIPYSITELIVTISLYKRHVIESKPHDILPGCVAFSHNDRQLSVQTLVFPDHSSRYHLQTAFPAIFAPPTLIRTGAPLSPALTSSPTVVLLDAAPLSPAAAAFTTGALRGLSTLATLARQFSP